MYGEGWKRLGGYCMDVLIMYALFLMCNAACACTLLSPFFSVCSTMDNWAWGTGLEMRIYAIECRFRVKYAITQDCQE